MTDDPRKVAAVVALGLAIPGADDEEAFWSILINGQTLFRPATTADFGADPQEFYDLKEPPALDKAYSLSGAWKSERPDLAFLGETNLLSSFDLNEADDSLLFWLAAGLKAAQPNYLAGHDPTQIGVIAGHVILPTTTQSEAAVALYGREATRAWEFNPFHPPPKTNPFRAVGYSARLLAHALGAKGPAFTVDAACASSLYAARLALDGLFSGQLTVAITGGLAKADPLFTQLGFSQLRALSRAGVARPFDQRADGLVVGSGAVALVLKTLDRAKRDGDPILALLLSVGLGNDRTGNLLAPDPKGQAKVMAEAFRLAKRTPLALGLIEAHGTSTVVGDQAEVAALKQFLKGQDLERPPVLGSVKGNVGHLLSAAGAVSLAKTVLALKNQTLLPTAGFAFPSVDLDSQPALRILTQPEKWPDPKSRPRLAVVNAFGFGGVNAQAVLEEYRPLDWLKNPQKTPLPKPPEPLAAALIASRTVLAPWPSYESLARFWLTPEEPPMAQTRRQGALKTTGFFFNQGLTLNAATLKLPPKELAEALPQQTLVLKAAVAALEAAGLTPNDWPAALDPDRVGIFMGVEIDPRAADYALRWTAPLRAVGALIDQGKIAKEEKEAWLTTLKDQGPPPLTHSRVLGALGSFVASRLARYLGSGGPAFTFSEERDSGFRALFEAVKLLASGAVDLAVVGVVDTFGDPKTGFLAPRTVWVEGAAIMILASPKAEKILPPLARLTLNAAESRIGPLSGLFTLNRAAFYLRHHLKPLGRGHGMAYWLKNPDETRSLAGPGYELVEAADRLPSTLTVPPDPIRPDVWFYFKASQESPLSDGLQRLTALLEANPNRDLLRLSLDFWAEEKDQPGEPTLAIQARDGRELAFLLKKALAGEEDRDLKPRILKAPPLKLVGDLAFVYPGSGNVYKGLGRGLGLAFPAIMAQLEAEVSDPLNQFQYELFWAPNPKKPTCREAILGQVNFALLGTRVLESLGLIPKAALGYSLGETAALVALGIWPDRDQLYRDLMESSLFNRDLAGELLAARTFWNWPAKKPLKWTAGLLPRSPKSVHKALDNLSPAFRFRAYALLVNTPEEVAIGGEEQAVAALAQSLEAPFFPVEEVAAVHAPTVGPVKEAFLAFHTRQTVARPNLSIYSSAWAKKYEPTPEACAKSLTQQALSGHNFPDLINQAYADGIRYFVEIGPGSSATRLVKAILGDQPHLATSLAGTAVDEGWSGVARILSEMWLNGQIADPFAGQPKPTPEPDPRFLAPINLDPPPLNWPKVALDKDLSPPLTEETKEPLVKEDYMNWLVSQTKNAPKSGPPKPVSPPESGSAPKPDRPPKPDSPLRPASLPKPDSPLRPGGRPPRIATAPKPPELLTRADCLEFALGSIAKVFGPKFAEVDSYPSRVLLPAEPLMLVDRVLVIEGEPKSLGQGRIVTQKDIAKGEWYLDEGRITPGLSIESGQADLMLSAYLGADFQTKGLSRYRLLDAEVVFFADPPKPGETATYDIRINRFFQPGDILMFQFGFDGTVNGQPLLAMREGRAGFFTPLTLQSGRGLTYAKPKVIPNQSQGADPSLYFLKNGPKSLAKAAIERLRQGDFKPLGKELGAKEGWPLLPSGPLALFDSAPEIDRSGGVYGQGFIKVKAKVKPKDWYLTCHFPKDEVMPGTLMYDVALMALRLYLITLGWVVKGAYFGPILGLAQKLSCRGQVTPKTKEVAYEIHVRELSLDLTDPTSPTLKAIADSIMLADNLPIAEAKNLGLRLFGLSPADLAELKEASPPASSIALKPPKTPTTTPSSELFFDKDRLNALILGQVSDVLGPKFARYNDGSFVARLPKAPYDFVDQAEITQGQAGQVALGSAVKAAWFPKPDSWVFTEAGGVRPILPYAALNEVALQACGLVAAFMGSSLLFDEPMYFRNLGGEATTFMDVTQGLTEPLITRATLTKASVLGQMTIQHYEFSTTIADQPVYAGQTHFGFFNQDNLQRQKGLKVEPDWRKAITPPAAITTIPYPEGPAWPKGQWRTLEDLTLEADAKRIWGHSRVDPNAWFFAAHFPQDPVWPGSLGLEGFFQAAKFLALRRFYSGDPLTFPGSFRAPIIGRKHSWLYRGQIPPNCQDMSLGLFVVKSDPHDRLLTFNGLLSIDDLVVYRVDNFTVALRDF